MSEGRFQTMNANKTNNQFKNSSRRANRQQPVPRTTQITTSSNPNKLAGQQLNAELKRRFEQSQRDKAAAGRSNIQPKQNNQNPRKPAGPTNLAKKSKSRGPNRQVGPGIFTTIGHAAGSLVGFPGVGKFLGNTVDRIMGHGDYVMNSPPVNKNSFVTGSPPQFVSKNGSMAETIVAHREYLGDIFSGGTLSSGLTSFNGSTFPLNPGVAGTFPWLSAFAANYEEYEWLGLIFEYKSTSGESLSSTNTALGSVILSTQYDPYNPAFTSKLAQENYEFAQSIKPSESTIHAVECKNDLNQIDILQTRTLNVPAGADLRLFDAGVFQISTVGCQGASVNLGELWVSYQVRFLKPKLGGAVIASDYFSFAQNSALTSYQPFYGAVAAQTNTLGSIPSQFDYRTLLFPSSAIGQTVLINWIGYCYNQTVGSYSVTPTGCTIVTQVSSPGTSGVTSAAVGSMSYTFVVKVNTSNASLQFYNNTTFALPGGALLEVTYVNPLQMKLPKPKHLEPALHNSIPDQDDSSSTSSSSSDHNEEEKSEEDERHLTAKKERDPDKTLVFEQDRGRAESHDTIITENHPQLTELQIRDLVRQITPVPAPSDKPSEKKKR